MPIQEPLPEQLEEENPVESPANPQPDDTEQTNEDAATSTKPPGQVAESTEGLTVGGTTKETPASPEDASEKPNQQIHENRQGD
jgi:hypothetical protein